MARDRYDRNDEHSEVTTPVRPRRMEVLTGSCAKACSAACRSVGFMPRSLASSRTRTRSSCRVAFVSGSGCRRARCVLRVNGISDPMMGLLDDGGAVRRGGTRFESDQQLMQDQEGRQRDLRRTDPKAGAIDRIKLPRRHDRHETRLQLDMHEHALRAPLLLDAAYAPPIEWVPAT